MPDPAPPDPLPAGPIIGTAYGLSVGNQGTINVNVRELHHAPFVPRETRATPAHWVDRPALTQAALDALLPGRTVALVGMGGAGKSALASRIALQAETRFARGCVWIDLPSGQLDHALLRIGLAFGHDLSALKSREALAQAARSLLHGQAVLLVLDDAWAADELGALLPPPDGCAALLTTRNDAIAAQCADTVVTIEQLGDAAALALLSAASGAAADEPALPRIAAALGGLPLALELAARFARQQLRRPGFSWAAFADEIGQAAARLGLGLAGSSVRLAFDASWQRGLDDAGRRAFALLGIFEPGGIGIDEAAAAWGLDAAAARPLVNALLDLSLAQLFDARTLRLHPLLADYAALRRDELAADEQQAAHRRVADHLFAVAPRPPESLAEIDVVLRSHRHAVRCGDADRARRVWPWFGQANQSSTSIPGLLIARGLVRRHVEQERLDFELSAGYAPWARAWALYRLGDVLLQGGLVREAVSTLQQAVDLMASPEIDDDGRVIGYAKFQLALGHALAAQGQADRAAQAYQGAHDQDLRSAQRGGVVGARSGALIARLQMIDLQWARSDEASHAQAAEAARQVFDEAERDGDGRVAVMAAARLAQALANSAPDEAVHWLQAAWDMGERFPGALQGQQGARYARQLAEAAVALSYNGLVDADAALRGLTLAVQRSRASGMVRLACESLYSLGNFLEHQHLLDRAPQLAAAWAAYALSDEVVREAEFGAPRNGAERIATRIAPRVDEAERDAVAAAVAADAWGVLAAAVAPHRLEPDPD